MLAAVIPQRKRYRSAQALVDYISEPDEERAQSLSQDLPADAKALIEYAARAGVSEGGVTAALRARGVTDPTRDQSAITSIFDATVQAVRAKGIAADHPIYHVVVNWQPGETPTAEQARLAVEHTLAGVGMQDAAAAWVIHRDKAHHHVHIAALKYDVDTLKALGPPKRDFLLLDKSMREIELAQGWAHSPGPYVAKEGHVVKAPKAERAETVNQRPEASVEKAKGLPGIQAFCERQGVTQAFRQAQSWDDLHAVAAAHGLHVEQKRGGLVLKARGITTDHVVKASALDRALAGPALEKRLGPFVSPSPSAPAARPVGRSFKDFQEAAAIGKEPMAAEQPGRTGKRDPAKRESQRIERQAGREGLYESFRAHQAAAPGQRKEALAGLKERHQAERKALFDALRSGRKAQISELSAAHGQEIAKLMESGLEAKARAALDLRHKAEREGVKAQFSGNWREWLEMRARMHGDPAAISALRGIKYREGRKKNQGKPGIEGEDLRLGGPIMPAAVGSIGGEDRWGLDTAQIEVSRDGTAVIYKDQAGIERMRDEGQRIALASAKDEDAMIAALTLAAKRYGGEVYITGDEEFRKRAAEECQRRGIEVANLELKTAKRSQAIDSGLDR